MGPIRRSVVLAAVLLAPAVSLAQSSARPPEAEEPIPRELALALLNMSPGPAGADIRVGKAPEDVPPELIPPGFQILGSTTQFDNAVIVLVASQQPDSAISALEGASSESRVDQAADSNAPRSTRIRLGRHGPVQLFTAGHGLSR